MRFWILLAAVVGYHIPDVYLYLIIDKHYQPEYHGMIVQVILMPGWLFFRHFLFIRLTNAAIYAIVAYIVALLVAKLRPRTMKNS